MDVDVKVEPSEMTDEQEFLLFDVLENGEEMETIDFDDVTEVPTSSKEDSQVCLKKSLCGSRPKIAKKIL